MIYVLALSLIGCLSVISHVIADRIVERQKQAALIVNVSGRQRMLSQRIAASALELSRTGNPAARREIESRLTEAIRLMENSHQALQRGSKALGITPIEGRTVTAIYTMPPYSLDNRVASYLQLAREFLALRPDQQAASRQLRDILEAAHGPILAALNAAVMEYQRNSEVAIEHLHRVIKAVVAVMLAMLLAEAIFIFRPLFRRLRRSATEYGTIVQASLDGFWVVDAAGRLRDVNDAQCRMLGYSREELLTLDLADIQAPECADETAARVEQIKQLGYSRFESRHRRKDGTTVDVEVSVVYVPELGEKFFAFMRDISERKATEAHLRLAASVFSHANEGITITDPDGTIVEINDSFTRVTGFSRDEAVGQNPRILKSGRQPKEFYEEMWRSLTEKDHWFGEIWNRRKTGEIYPELLSINAVRDPEGSITNYVALFTDITKLKDHQKQLEFIAHYDVLTGLPNRILLADRIHQAIAQGSRRGQLLAVAYVDLDGFKEINDRHGHEIGDRLLAAVSRRMKAMLREGDTLARIGGDEFVAVLTDLDRAEDCNPVVDRLLEAAAHPLLVNGLELQVSASIGVALCPDGAQDADLLLRNADQAMYQAKEAGKNRCHHFDASHAAAVSAQGEIRQMIRGGMERGEFVLYYQPKVNLESGEVVGAEALIRWRHPQRGLLPPAAFLPAIANDPIELDLGQWVIDTALRQIDRWTASGLGLPVSVNVSAGQLQCGDFVQCLSVVLHKYPGVHPGRLVIEILESSAIADIASVTALIAECREIGVRFALDDFGTGYSSLTYLRHLPIDFIKIDQTFVRQMLDSPEDHAIVEGIVGLARAFRRQVIAEGVETAAHGELLLRLGCQLAQGYGIARPMPAEDVPAWVASWQSSRKPMERETVPQL